MICTLHAPDNPCRSCGRDVWRLDRVMFVGGAFSHATGYWSCITCNHVENCAGTVPEKPEPSERTTP